MSNGLMGLTVSNTFGRLVQVVGGLYYDGFGNLLDIGNELGPTGPQGPKGPTGPSLWGGITGSISSQTDLQEILNSKQNVTTLKNANNSTNTNINYCGVAPGLGVSESLAVWTITRLTITASGFVTTTTATNVAWTDRETVVYI